MQFRPRLKIWLYCKLRLRRGFGRRLVAAAALVAFVVTACGVPLPLPADGKDRSRPFPCVDRPCGCRSADQCWRQCCCFTMQQKLAWARENGVEPPAFVVAAAKRESLAKKTCSQPKCKSCSLGNKTPVSKQAVCAATKGCCDAKEKAAATVVETLNKHRAAARPAEDSPNNSNSLIGSLALRCQGTSSLWTSVAGCLPRPMLNLWAFDWQLVGCLSCGDDTVASAELDPPNPPPKLAESLA